MTFKLKILGSNAAAPAHNRNQTSQLVQVNNHIFLIDCGEGTQLLLKKHKVKFSRINHIFISHLHGDHYFGLIGLISTIHLYGRVEDLYLYGPPGLGEIISLQLKHSNTTLKFDIKLKEWEPGEVETLFEDKLITVQSFPTDHRIACSGYLIKEKPLNRRIVKEKLPEGILPSQIGTLKNGKDVVDEDGNLVFKNADHTADPRKAYTYAYCADTKYTELLIPLLKGADLVYHEATFMEDMAERAELTYHSTAKQAALFAKKARVGKLVLGHFSTRYKNLEPVLQEAREVFSESYLGLEGEEFVLLA